MIPASVSIVSDGFPGCSICSTTIASRTDGRQSQFWHRMTDASRVAAPNAANDVQPSTRRALSAISERAFRARISLCSSPLPAATPRISSA